MGDIFLSASVPMPNRGDFHESADPFLIQFAVRELLSVCLGRRRIVWGGHPSITPMVWAVCEDLGVQYAECVLLYQSRFFEERFPEENRRFGNVVYIEAGDDREDSLRRLRQAIFDIPYEAGVFVGGMEGVMEEYRLFVENQKNAKAVVVGSTGGAARRIAQEAHQSLERVDYASMFYELLQIKPTEVRKTSLHKS